MFSQVNGKWYCAAIVPEKTHLHNFVLECQLFTELLDIRKKIQR